IRRRPGAAELLLAEDTFFSYLLRRALGTAGDGARQATERAFAKMVEAYRSWDDESLSGPGSTLAQTAGLRERLPLLLEALGVRSLVDAPCGDHHWLGRTALGVEHYVGLDVLQELVERNVHYHGSPLRRFACADVRVDPIPAADAILCRDLLVHLS